MGRSAWYTLAEALDIQTEINWDNVNKRRQMQQNGTMDRRNKQGPMPYFKTPGQQRQMQQAQRGRINPNAMAQIPAGTDVPMQQPNPLFAPPARKSALSTPPNSPQARGMGMGQDQQADEDF